MKAAIDQSNAVWTQTVDDLENAKKAKTNEHHKHRTSAIDNMANVLATKRLEQKKNAITNQLTQNTLQSQPPPLHPFHYSGKDHAPKNPEKTDLIMYRSVDRLSRLLQTTKNHVCVITPIRHPQNYRKLHIVTERC